MFFVYLIAKKSHQKKLMNTKRTKNRNLVLMPKITTYIKITKNTLWMCVVLFALSPCIVKESLLGSLNIEYVKPLNKSKTTTKASSCQYSQSENQYITAVKQTKTNKQIVTFNFLDNQHFKISSIKLFVQYSKTFFGKSPPKYILYKCLKLDVA